MVGMVSFAGTPAYTTSFKGGDYDTKTFQDMVSKPQAFQAEKPSASTGISKGDKKKKSLPKTILKLTAGAAAIAAVLAGVAHSGKLVANPEGNKIVTTIINGINGAGNAVISAAKTVISKIHPKEAVEAATDVIA